MYSRAGKRWGPLRSLLFLSPVLIGAPWLAIRDLHSLPEPVIDLLDPVTGHPQLSEHRILSHSRHLSENIGYRTVGTREHALADQWMLQQVQEIRSMCEEENQRQRSKSKGPTRELECEVWHQVGSGSHRFDMMGERVYKTYVNLTNIVLRVSATMPNEMATPEEKKHAVLVNAHLDSTLPSPGAADDALPVGVMLECARVLVMDPEWVPHHPVVFLFNNAEESLQDGSHLFSTQSPIRETIRAVINLEAAGTTGRELLFQATSKDMISAYSHVPRPFGTVFANEVFSSGILLSDTDFRQFQHYLNVPGLDMAIVGNSYLYHTRKDLVKNIQTGVAQNMALNTLALLKYLTTSPESPLHITTTNSTLPLPPPRTVFFSYLGKFFMFSFTTAGWAYAALVVVAVVIAITMTSRKASSESVLRTYLRAASFHFAGFLGSIVTANATALFLKYVLGRGMGWFADWRVATALFGTAAVFGTLFFQLLLLKLLSSSRNPRSSLASFHQLPITEHALLSSLAFLHALAAFVTQVCFEKGSAVMFGITAAPLLAVLMLDPVFSRMEGIVERWRNRGIAGQLDNNGNIDVQSGNGGKEANETMASRKTELKTEGGGNREREPQLALTTYALGQALPLITGTLLLVPTLEVFVPLSGRAGTAFPGDILLATIISVLISLVALPLLVPFVYRFWVSNDISEVIEYDGTKGATPVQVRIPALRKGVMRVGTVVFLMIAWVAQRQPFDADHPRRVFFMHAENITLNERHLHIAIADGAPGFDRLVSDVAAMLDVEMANDTYSHGAKPMELSSYNSDWDVIYPYSNFLASYKLPLDTSPDYAWAKEGSTFQVVAVESQFGFEDELELEGRSMFAQVESQAKPMRTRRVKLEVRHPGLIWTVIAFDAHVLEWNLDERPPDEYARHRVKEASFYGVDTWTLDMVIAVPSIPAVERKESEDRADTLPDNHRDRATRASHAETELDKDQDKLLINFVGIQEKGMWPGKKAEGGDGAAMSLFENLDDWLERHTQGAVDAMMVGCIAGAVWV